MMRLAPIVLLLGGAAGSCRAAPAAGAPREAAAATARKYQVGAFYYGPWHVDPTNEKLHGKNWSECMATGRGARRAPLCNAGTKHWKGDVVPRFHPFGCLGV